MHKYTGPLYKQSDFGITPEQYHYGLDKLWSAIGPEILDVFQYDAGNDVFSIASGMITNLKQAEDKLKADILTAIELIPDYSDKDWNIQPDNLKCDIQAAKTLLQLIIQDGES